jgi:ABC-type phosphate transport system substrate-binding protein
MSLRPPSLSAFAARALGVGCVWLMLWSASPFLRVHALDAGDAFQVIAHPKTRSGVLTRDFVAQVFLKRVTRWSDGSAIRPVDQRPDAPVRRAFSERVLARSVTAVRSYWQQRIFSGRDLPPPELDSDDAVVRYVVNTPGAIGYIAPGKKPGDAKPITLR